jgi:serine/threonine protein kinase
LKCIISYFFRDLKPQNTLINKDGTVKISDFNLALKLEDTYFSNTCAKQRVGTPAFRAPEIKYVSFLIETENYLRKTILLCVSVLFIIGDSYAKFRIDRYYIFYCFQGDGCCTKSDVFSAGLFTVYISRKGSKMFRINCYDDLNKEIVQCEYENGITQIQVTIVTFKKIVSKLKQL